MNKLFVMIVLRMFVAQSMVAQKRATSDREFYLLKGPVKTVRVESAEIKLRDGQGTRDGGSYNQ
jgi:hypothetical protein